IMSEEATQIGVIMAIGGRSWHVAATYLIYGAIIGVTGAGVGLAIGTWAGRRLSGYLTSLTGLQQPSFSIQLAEVGLALSVGLAVAIAGSLLPALRSSRRRVASLLKH